MLKNQISASLLVSVYRKHISTVRSERSSVYRHGQQRGDLVTDCAKSSGIRVFEELWQPKNFPVIFRMYQLNFDGNDERVYDEYRNRYANHFVEEL